MSLIAAALVASPSVSMTSKHSGNASCIHSKTIAKLSKSSLSMREAPRAMVLPCSSTVLRMPSLRPYLFVPKVLSKMTKSLWPAFAAAWRAPSKVQSARLSLPSSSVECLAYLPASFMSSRRCKKLEASSFFSSVFGRNAVSTSFLVQVTSRSHLRASSQRVARISAALSLSLRASPMMHRSSGMLRKLACALAVALSWGSWWLWPSLSASWFMFVCRTTHTFSSLPSSSTLTSSKSAKIGHSVPVHEVFFFPAAARTGRP
mmetsp:Transcript_14507/g.42593  ORF Transcript_14507/g.42593 Transcript_14507/m.42593 type:complete len:261 (-) Transcript_14507:778-1560(-)